MKKLLSCVFVIMLLIQSSALAEIDLSGLTFDELVTLKDQINLEMWSREEWQEVTVPQGIWEIGKDIPAGHWTVKAADGAQAGLLWGNSMMSDTMVSPDYWCWTVTSPTSVMYDENQSRVEIDGEFKDGQFLQVMDGKAVITPYSGKPSLSFK